MSYLLTMAGTPIKWCKGTLRLGRERDHVIAAALGCSRQAITWKRSILAIHPCRARVPEEMLGTMTDTAIAKATGVPRRTVSGRRARIGRLSVSAARYARVLADPDLGVLPDRVLAERHMVSRSSIARIRSSIGIKGRVGRPAQRSALLTFT